MAHQEQRQGSDMISFGAAGRVVGTRPESRTAYGCSLAVERPVVYRKTAGSSPATRARSGGPDSPPGLSGFLLSPFFGAWETWHLLFFMH